MQMNLKRTHSMELSKNDHHDLLLTQERNKSCGETWIRSKILRSSKLSPFLPEIELLIVLDIVEATLFTSRISSLDWTLNFQWGTVVDLSLRPRPRSPFVYQTSPTTPSPAGGTSQRWCLAAASTSPCTTSQRPINMIQTVGNNT